MAHNYAPGMGGCGFNLLPAALRAGAALSMWLPPMEPSIEKGVGTAWLLTRLLPGISLAQDIANFSITGYQPYALHWVL